jgi:hypothetical protein
MVRPKKLPTVLTEGEQELFLQQANPRYPTGEKERGLPLYFTDDKHTVVK